MYQSRYIHKKIYTKIDKNITLKIDMNLENEIKKNLSKLDQLIKQASRFDCYDEIIKEANQILDTGVTNIEYFIEKEEKEKRDTREDVFQHKDNLSWFLSQQL